MYASLDKRVGTRARYGLAGGSAGPRAERSARSVARGFGMSKSIHRGSRMPEWSQADKGLSVEGYRDSRHRHGGEANAARDGTAVVAVLQNGMLFLEVLSAAKGRVGGHDRPIGAASSAGRALRSQCRGRGFDPPAVHQIPSGKRRFHSPLAS